MVRKVAKPRWKPKRKYTVREIQSVRNQKGGYTRRRLEKLGVPWPPPKGWRKAILASGRHAPEKPTERRVVRKTHMRGCPEHDLVCFLNGAPSHWRATTDWAEVTCKNCLQWLGQPRCYPCAS